MPYMCGLYVCLIMCGLYVCLSRLTPQWLGGAQRRRLLSGTCVALVCPNAPVCVCVCVCVCVRVCCVCCVRVVRVVCCVLCVVCCVCVVWPHG